MASLAASLEEEARREFRRFLALSALAHGIVLLGMLVVPFGSSRTMVPGVIQVDLVAMPGAPAAPAPAAPEPAEVAPVAPPKPAPPVAKKVVLPEQPQKPVETPRPRAEVPKPTPRAKPEAPPPSKPKPEAEYEDVLAQLRKESGEARPEAARPAATAGAAAAATGGGGRGVPVSPQVAAWLRSARNHVRRSWILAPGFRMEPLETHVEVELDAAGHVRGEPRITRRSGNPWYDESVVRAIEKASPLPAPPKPGAWPFVFRPEEY